MKIISILLIGFFLLIPPGFSKSKKAKGGSGTSETAKSFGEGVDQIGADVVDVIVDEVTGKKTTVTKTTPAQGALPPGLAKQGKVPPGHAKKSTTVEVEKKDSLVQSFVRGLLNKGKNE